MFIACGRSHVGFPAGQIDYLWRRLMRLLTSTKGRYATAIMCTLSFFPLLPPAVSADDIAAAPFTMAVLTNEAYGTRVISGKYEQVIDRLTRGGARATDGFAEQTNLCVAYTKITDLTGAIAACEAAIAAVKEREFLARRRSKHSAVALAYRSDLAIALSNHGVLLAVQGAVDEARATFEAAIALDARASGIAARNLDRLTLMSGPGA